MSEKPQNRYGLLSMISIIVGTVIGSGIYVKNSTLMESTNSAILSMIGWILGGLIVLSILVAIIEISSITKNKNEQGTLNAWAKYFWGPKMSRLFTAYFLFIYFPLIIAAESIFSINQLFESHAFVNSYVAFSVGTFLPMLMICCVFSFTIFTIKPGKVATSVGSVVKIIPLVLIISVMLLMLFGLPIKDAGLNNVFDPNSPINEGISNNPLKHVLIILPAILFAFDGFLYSASLSAEAKKPSTFKMAAIISIVFITLIYILFSLSTYALADVVVGDNTSYQISSVITAIWPNADWLNKTISIIISFSILTAVIGYAILSMWSFADASNTNEIVDKDGELIRRYKSGTPYRSGFWILALSLIALLFMRSYDLIAILIAPNSESVRKTIPFSGEGNMIYIGMTDYISNLFSVIDFTFYILLIFGGIRNRFTKNVEVERESLFWPASIIAIIGVFIVVGAMLSGTVNDLISGFQGVENDDTIIASLQLSSIIILILAIGLIYTYLTINTNKQTPEVWENKQKYQEAYKNKQTMKEYVASL